MSEETNHYFVSSVEVREEIKRALAIEKEHLFNALSKALKEQDDQIKKLEGRIKFLEEKSNLEKEK